MTRRVFLGASVAGLAGTPDSAAPDACATGVAAGTGMACGRDRQAKKAATHTTTAATDTPEAAARKV